MAFEEITSQQVRDLRTERGCSMMSAKAELEAVAARGRIKRIREAGQTDLADVLEWLVASRGNW